jgi:protein kinase/serine/threonine-protein kinase
VSTELENIEKGIPTTERVAPKRKPITSKEITVTFGLKKLFIPALIVVALVIAGVVIWQLLPKKEVAPLPSEKPSIAVLPFVDLSPQKDQEYFCDGMTDEIISKLSMLKGWKVIPRTTMMRYKDTNKDIKEIGQELDVATVLEGSVRKERDEIRVNAKLIRIKDSIPLWSDAYEKKLESVFAIQSDVAEKIANTLQVELSPEEKEQLEKKPTENLTAYDYYLKGYEYYYRYKKQDNELAIELFKQALELDPDFALAYAGLGDAYSQRVQRYGFPPTMLDEAIEASKKAISIDPYCSEAYKALGLANFTKGWLREAAKAYKKAVELNPNNAPAIISLGLICIQIGELEKAMRWTKSALALSPAQPYAYGVIGWIYSYLDDLAKDEESLKKALELQPDLDIANEMLIFCYIAQGKNQQAIEHSQKFLSISPNSLNALIWAGHTALLSDNYEQAKQYYQKANSTIDLGYVYWKTGQKEKAQKLLQESLDLFQAQLEQGSEFSTVPYNIATIYAIQGNKEEAYKWLLKAIDAGWRHFRLGLTDPLLENLHEDAQFKQMMAQVKETVDEMRKRIEEKNH